jgi:hypothetical protein
MYPQNVIKPPFVAFQSLCIFVYRLIGQLFNVSLAHKQIFILDKNIFLGIFKCSTLEIRFLTPKKEFAVILT